MWGLHAALASAHIDIDIPLFFGAKKRDSIRSFLCRKLSGIKVKIQKSRFTDLFN